MASEGDKPASTGEQPPTGNSSPTKPPSQPSTEITSSNRKESFDFQSSINVSEINPEIYMRKDSMDLSGAPKPNTIHSRGVSWDTELGPAGYDPKPIPRPGIVQPQFSDATRSPRRPPRPPMMKTASRRSARGNNFMVGTSTRKIDLGPLNVGVLETEAENMLLELEAETNLLRQIDDERERIEPQNNILPGVNDAELKHDFSPAPPSPRTPTRAVHTRAISRDMPSPMPPKPDLKAHRRQLTVEETLFGLTAALSAVHHAESKKYEHPPDEQKIGNRERADTGGTYGATDRLERAANVFFRKLHRDSIAVPTEINAPADDSSPNATSQPAPAQDPPQPSPQQTTQNPGTETPAASKWGKLRESILSEDGVALAKKTDSVIEPSIKEEEEADLVEADLEVGGSGTESERKGTAETSDDDVLGKLTPTGFKETSSGKEKRKSKRKSNPFRHLPYADKIKAEWDMFSDFLRPRKTTAFQYTRIILLYIWIPALGVASILYHLADNPPTGKGEDAIISDKASASWWIIFVCIREVFIVCLAKIMQVLMVDYFALQTRASLKLCGPLVTLLLVQSKGWPFIIFFWGIFNFALVTGTYTFSNHWLYWQNFWGLFNENNPSGNVTSSHQFYVLCAVAVGVGASVSLKRLLVSVLLGRQTFSNYSQPLAKVMNKMLHISEVAGLAKDIEKRYWYEQQTGYILDLKDDPKGRNLSNENLRGLIATTDAEDIGGEDVSMMDATMKSGMEADMHEKVVDTDDIDPYTGSLSYAQRARIRELLGQWEEPARGPAAIDQVSISSVLHFRRALAYMDTDYPFSAAFGVADTRENCVTSAQAVYERLLLKNNLSEEGYVHFDTIATLALRKHADIDKDKLKDFIRTFRPDRDGGISMVDFVRSVDAVYKELRMLKATVANSSKIDKALEKIFNIFFYVLLAAVILSQTGFDVLALFISLSSVVLAFAFMIGSASAKYFEGLLFILVQRPYGIGDRINVANPESESSYGGAQGWIVENVTLFTTTVVLAGTQERATISNGTLAKSRIINGARSPKPVCYVNMKFGIDTPYRKVEIFKSAVEKFVKNRPREWVALAGFRCARIEADQGFIEYTIVLQHRESWQNIVPVLNSKHTIHCFCLELAKKLEMRYKSPPLPVDLKMVGKNVPQFDIKYGQEKSPEEYAEQKLAHSKKSSDMDFTTSPHSVGDDSAELDEIAAMFEGK